MEKFRKHVHSALEGVVLVQLVLPVHHWYTQVYCT